MVDTGIFATTTEILRKAGVGASVISSAEEFTNQFVSEAESYINVLSGVNFSDPVKFAALHDGTKNILKEAASNLAAIYVIQYDFDGYPNLRIAENIMNTNWRRFMQCVKLLIDNTNSGFLING